MLKDRSKTSDQAIDIDLLNAQYKYGFVYSDAVPNHVPDHYVPIGTGNHLYVCPHQRYGFCSSRGAHVVVLGTVVQSDRGLTDNETIARHLHGIVVRLLAGSGKLQSIFTRSDFTEYEKYLCGRYVIIVEVNGEGWCLSDAIGQKPIFRSVRGPKAFFASHARLCASQIGDLETNDTRFNYGYFGLDTPYNDVVLNNPSCASQLAPDESVQIITQRPIATATSLQDAATGIVAGATTSLKLFRSIKPLLVSLSAGEDSRLTLGLFERSPEGTSGVKFFTYQYPVESIFVDVEIAGRLSENFNLAHKRILSTDAKDLGKEIKDRIELRVKENVYTRYALRFLTPYVYRFDIDRYLHVRSNMFEFFRSSAVDKRCELYRIIPNNSVSATKIYKSMIVPKVTDSLHLQQITKAFQSFYDRFGSDSQFKDGRDRYFIEHRMAAWASHVSLESDVAFDTVIPVNSRVQIQLALTTTKEERLSGKLLDEMKRLLNPELYDLPINPALSQLGLEMRKGSGNSLYAAVIEPRARS